PGGRDGEVAQQLEVCGGIAHGPQRRVARYLGGTAELVVVAVAAARRPDPASPVGDRAERGDVAQAFLELAGGERRDGALVERREVIGAVVGGVGRVEAVGVAVAENDLVVVIIIIRFRAGHFLWDHLVIPGPGVRLIPGGGGIGITVIPGGGGRGRASS